MAGRPGRRTRCARRTVKGTEGKLVLDWGSLYPKQAEFFRAEERYVAYGGARGGGKSHAVRIKAACDGIGFPGIKILIMRRSYPELEENHILPMRKLLPEEIAQYGSTARSLFFSNGSRIRFGHLNGAGDIDEYQGLEFDEIFIDEATHFTENEFRTLGACVRGVNGFPKRMYLTCNPGGVGHAWVKRLFVDRAFRKGENPADYKFIFATVDDNEALMKHSPDYVRMLDLLPESIRRAHRYGDWNALAGAYFREFNPDIHVAEPFGIPSGWVRYRAFDYGLDMFACLWIAVDFGGRAYVYREINRKGLLVSEAARLMLDMTPDYEKISYTIAPPDLWSTQKDTGHTMAEVFASCGVGLVKAPNSRVQGWLMLRERLRPGTDGAPALRIFRNCRTLVENLGLLQHDGKNPDDVAKEPHELTHNADALRYFCASRCGKAEKREEPDGRAQIGYEEIMTGGEAPEAYLYYGY